MKLSEPLDVGPMHFRNRIYHLPIGEPGHRSEVALEYYCERARGGVSAVTTGGLANMENLRHPTDELKRFATEVKSADPACYVGTQTLAIYGPEKTHKRPLTPSGTWSEATRLSIAVDFPDPRPLEIAVEEIHQYTAWMAEAAAAQKAVGFDFIELHATHAYIWRQFLSPMDNHREDEYGGPIENRVRWMCETVQAIRAAAGPDFGILFRLAAMEPEHDGISLADSCRAAQLLEAAGVDALIISEGANSHNRGFIASCVPLNISFDRNCYTHWAEAIRRHVGIPVMAVGRITQPLEAEAILESGQADLIGLARALMADPEWPNKAIDGNFDAILPCLGCNTCFDRQGYDHMTCSVNARLCDEAATRVHSTNEPRRTMVVGSGPAGMEAARIAAERGHQVSLYESAPRLGGLLLSAAAGHGKQDVDLWRVFLEKQLDHLDIDVHLNTEVNEALVRQIQPDSLVLAIGAKPRSLNVPGAALAHVVPAETVITGEVPVGRQVVVIGGGMVGLETAEHLAETGHTVTVCARSRLASDFPPLNRPAILDNVAMAGVICYENTRINAIEEDGVDVTIDGAARHLPADSVVLAIGSDADADLIERLRAIVADVHVVGDANGNARFREAVIEAHSAARAL